MLWTSCSGLLISRKEVIILWKLFLVGDVTEVFPANWTLRIVSQKFVKTENADGVPTRKDPGLSLGSDHVTIADWTTEIVAHR
jgi:hypothetical protein